MASNWSKLFLRPDGGKMVSPLVLIFIALQALIIVVVIINIVMLNDDKAANDDLERYKKLPELSVTGLANKAPDLTESEISDIQKKIFKIVSENTSNISTNEIEAKIRGENVHMRSFDENTKYLNMTIDIPSLEQSYEVFYSSNAVIDPDVSTFVLCLDDDTEKVYENFECKSSDNASIRDTVVSSYLGRFRFEYFSAYFDPEKPNTITISPSVTYDNDEATKKGFVNEVKLSIESLGIPSSRYEYYVRTAADVNYYNPR